jgi:Uma2 family endonuclease
MELVATLSETIRERLKTERIVCVEATLDEYFDELDEIEKENFKIEYAFETIFASMSQASEPHETIVANLIRLIGNAYVEKDDFRVLASGRIVFSPDCKQAYNPDAIVVKGETELFPRRKKIAAMTNPYLIVEVQSDSTNDIDIFEKLPCYKSFDSVMQIVYVAQRRPFVSVYTKNQDQLHWINEDYRSMEATVKVDGFEIAMKDIYRKIVFPKK